MPTLHETTHITKIVLLILLTIIVGSLLLTFFIAIGRNIKERLYPTPPPPPTVLFGKLPQIDIPSKKANAKITYSIDTLSGTFPVFPDRAKVYRILTLQPRLLALQKAQEKVGKLGFTESPQKISENIYQWNEDIPPLRKLTLDIFSLNFKVSSDFLSDINRGKEENLPTKEKALEESQSFLSSISYFSDIDSQKTKITLLGIDGGKLIQATSLSKAKIYRVDFFQNDIDHLPIMYPNPPFSTMNTLVAEIESKSKVVEANLFHKSADTEIFATYPIINSKDAFEILKKNSSFIVSSDLLDTKVVIKNIYLAYFLSETQQSYLMPIIVFEGNNGFYAYIPAITNEWISQ